MTVIAANADRYPVSAQCEILGVARSTYYSMRLRAEGPKSPDPIERDVIAAHEASHGRYGARKIKAALSRAGITASRRRICRIMRENSLISAYGSKRFKRHRDVPNGADVPNAVARRFGGRAPRTHACSDLTYVRVGGGWNCVCLPVDLRNREIMGHSAGPRKDADPVRAAFATLEFPVSDIEVICNCARIHTALGDLSPVKFEEANWPERRMPPEGGVKVVKGIGVDLYSILSECHFSHHRASSRVLSKFLEGECSVADTTLMANSSPLESIALYTIPYPP